jgi:hypothetical protein
MPVDSPSVYDLDWMQVKLVYLDWMLSNTVPRSARSPVANGKGQVSSHCPMNWRPLRATRSHRCDGLLAKSGTFDQMGAK